MNPRAKELTEELRKRLTQQDLKAGSFAEPFGGEGLCKVGKALADLM